jgi:hypothetical protein
MDGQTDGHTDLAQKKTQFFYVSRCKRFGSGKSKVRTNRAGSSCVLKRETIVFIVLLYKIHQADIGRDTKYLRNIKRLILVHDSNLKPIF